MKTAKEKIIFLSKYYLLLTITMMLLRIAFMFVAKAEDFPASSYLDVAIQGLKLDLAVAGYFTAIPLLIVIASIFTDIKLRTPLRIYNAFIATAISAAAIADMVLYPFWQFKLDASFLIYMDTPSNAMASVSIGFIILRVTVAIMLSIGLTLLYNCIIPEKANRQKRKILPTLSMILFGGIIFLFVRGGVTESTNNPGKVFFSNKIFLNHSAINPLFNFIYSLQHNEDFRSEYNFFDEKERNNIFAGLYPHDTTLTDTLLNNKRPNVLVIILEGMSAAVIEELGGAKGVTPNFSSLTKEGVFFTNCYANSFRTDRGLISTLSGYSAFPKTSVMKSPAKSNKLPSIASSLGKVGYNSTLVYGGDIDFTNMRGYFSSTGYGKYYSDEDFPSSAEGHTWGVNDDVVFARLEEVIEEQPRDTPWHITLLTLSSHEPWQVPYNRIPKDNVANAFAYTDDCLGTFIENFRRSDQWNNTLIVCLPDHSVSGYPKGVEHTDRNRNHIPILLLGGAVKEAKEIDVLCNQSDLAATLLAQMELPTDDFIFSRNVLSPSYTYPFAYNSYNNGFSIIDESGFSVFDLDAKKIIFEEPSDANHKRIEKGKAILQTTYEHYYHL